MNDLIERAALAAWVAYAVRDEDLDSEDEGDYNRAAAIRDWNESPQSCTHMGADGFRAVARAALQAIREATPAMIEAGRWPAEDDGPLACWQAMIDEALK